MARVDSFDRVVEIDLDVDLDLDNSNIEMNNSDNSSQSPPTSSEFSDPSVSGYQLEQNYFSSDNSDNDFYEIETNSDEEELPTYPLTNFEMTIFQNDMPHLLMHEVDDELNEWKYETIDSGPLTGPFLSKSSSNITDLHGEPEIFFNSLFDERMWTILADATNNYARCKSQTIHGN